MAILINRLERKLEVERTRIIQQGRFTADLAVRMKRGCRTCSDQDSAAAEHVLALCSLASQSYQHCLLSFMYFTFIRAPLDCLTSKMPCPINQQQSR